MEPAQLPAGSDRTIMSGARWSRVRVLAGAMIAALALAACSASASSSAPSADPLGADIPAVAAPTTSVSPEPSASASEPAVPAASPRILALGESITGGGYLPEAQRTPWPSLLAPLLPEGSSVVNVARGGTGLVMTSPDGTPSTVDALAKDLAEHPGTNLVVVAAGRNDLHNRGDAALKAGYRTVEKLAAAAGAEAWFTTILPVSASYQYRSITEDQRLRINSWLRATYGDRLVDLDAALDPRRTGLLPKSFDFGDGFHPSLEGHQVIATAIAGALARSGAAAA